MPITLYVVLIFTLAHIYEPWGLFHKEFLCVNIEKDIEAKILFATFIVFVGITALAMITSEICAHIMRPSASPELVPPLCAPGYVVINIPFFSLNLSIVLVILVSIFVRFFFVVAVPPWLLVSALLTAMLATNQMARKHVALRMRQQLDRIIIGRNNIRRYKTVEHIVSVALVPLAGHRRDTPSDQSANVNV